MVYFTKIAGTRLGNWMFMYAAAVSLSRDGTVGCYLENGNTDDPITKHPFFANVKFVDKRPDIPIYTEPRFRFDPLPRDSADGLLLRGYFQSPKYFDREKIVPLFRPTEEVASRLREKYAEALSYSDLTGISVRRGDYLRYPHQFPFVGKRYLTQAIAAHPEVTHFLVCSDDISWCHRFFTKARFPGKRFYFTSGQNATDDLYLPSMCRNNILGNSSFSWWGGYLNENPRKFTIAPSRWFGFDFSRKGLDWSDIYYDDTQIINNDYSILEYAYAWLRGSFGHDILRKKMLSPVRRKINLKFHK